VTIEALPFVNWIFWAALCGGSMLVVGITELLGGTTRGYRLFMAGFFVVCAAIWVLSELNLPPIGSGNVPTAATEAVRRPLVLAWGGVSLVYLLLSVRDAPRAWLAIAGGLLGIVALVTLAIAGGTQMTLLFAGQLVLIALVLGSVNAAMLLGHWYLVTPQLSPDPLKRMMAILLVGLVIQVLAFALAVALGPDATAGEMGWLTWLRLVAGILIPIVATVLAWLATRAASLQASTGLLYIRLALIIAGSIAGPSIAYLTGVPV
jgi:hypothetical protein